MIEQLIINSVISSSFFFLIALGFSIIYQTSRFFHFAHAVVFTVGAYSVFLINNIFDINVFIAIISSIALCFFLGGSMELFIFKPLRNRNSSSMVLLIASLGVYIVIQNIISLFFGDNTKSIEFEILQKGFNFFGGRITGIQLSTIILSFFFFSMFYIWFGHSKFGKAIRTVSDNPELTKIIGINSDKIRLLAFAIGSTLAGLSGILMALDVDMNPTMGFYALLMGVIAVIVGGFNSLVGIFLASLLLGFSQNLSAWFFSSQWQDVSAFLILILFLLIRPHGFGGKPLKKAEI